MCDLVLFDNFNLLNCKWISNGLHDSFYSFSSVHRAWENHNPLLLCLKVYLSSKRQDEVLID